MTCDVGCVRVFAFSDGEDVYVGSGLSWTEAELIMEEAVRARFDPLGVVA